MPDLTDVDAFLQRQLDLLQLERNAEIEQSNLLLSKCSPKLLEQKGLALLNLSVANIQVGLGGRSLIELERSSAYSSSPALPPHTFRPGDLGRLESHSASTARKGKSERAVNSAIDDSLVEGVIYKASNTRIVLAVNQQTQEGSEEPNIPELCRLIKIANNKTHDRMEKIIHNLRQTLIPGSDSEGNKLKLEPETSKVIDVLFGLARQSPPLDLKNLQFYDESLNESQQQAVRFAVGAKELACIHGPPGTGKTHTLLEIIRQHLRPRGAPDAFQLSKKILVCGASNLSVDNILERLLAPPLPGMTPIKCTRIGHPARVRGSGLSLDATLDAQSAHSEQAELLKDVRTELSNSLLEVQGKAKGQKGKRPRGVERRKLWDDIKELRREFRRREKSVVKNILSETQVIVATCHSSGGHVLDNTSFDLVIVDEATQALGTFFSFQACWIPILKGKKLILAGDPMQLPPTVLSEGRKSKQREQPKKDSKKVVARTQKEKASKKTKPQASQGKEPINKEESGANGSSTSSEDDIDEGTEAHRVQEPTSDGMLPELRPPRSLSTTLFRRLEKMYGKKVKVMLEVQYRMGQLICQFPSETLYESRLIPDDSVSAHLLADLENTSAGLEGGSGEGGSAVELDDVLKTPIIFFDTVGCEYFEKTNESSDEESKCNENEAMMVKLWIEKLVACGVLPLQIAVITPYQAQVTLITSLLAPSYGSELEIGTVDGMQGREKEAIVISLVRSNEKREVGFLRDKRRLNVAMTRARRHMCVIGDSSTVKHGGPFLKKWMAWLEDNTDVRYCGLDNLS